MAEEEAEREYNTGDETTALKTRFHRLIAALKDSTDSPIDASANFCNEFCQILVEHGGQWKSEEAPLPLLEMYTVAILCFAEATPNLMAECEHATVVLEKLSLSCLDFLLSLSEKVPGALWEEFQSSVRVAQNILLANGNSQLSPLMAVCNETGIWTNSTLCSLLSNNTPDTDKVHELLAREGPTLMDMRIKHLIKQKCVEQAAMLAKACAEFPEFGGKKNFKQIYLVCLCETVSQQELMEQIKNIDCKDALDMICNLESEENEKGALNLCTAFLKRQLLQGDVYCAWELTLFWSKLLIRLESAQAFLDQCRLLAQLSGSVYHILLIIKVIQSEVQNEGLPVCIEMCIQALKMGVSDNEDCNTTFCKTISCLLPLDLEVKRACQLTEFLMKPTADSYYAVETLFNEPDQKLEEESLPIPNSLRCDLLLALKTLWPFDPEFWDWKTLRRHCLALMGEEASFVTTFDMSNETEDNEGLLFAEDSKDFKDLDIFFNATNELSDMEAEKKKKREMKKLREKGFVSARFRNWQAYMQYCVLCDKEFLGHRIVKHALKHVQDGLFRCPICTKTFETRAVLEPHVASHVKQSCKERLAAMNAKKPGSGSTVPLMNGSKQVYIKSVGKVGQIAIQALGSSNTKAKTKTCSTKQGNPVRDVENTEDCSCPVTSCQKVFKYFRNLVAHVKAHKDDEEARQFLEIQSQKAICQYCRRQFVNLTHLKDHLQIHSGDKPYVCIQLGCQSCFGSNAELLMHKKQHLQFQGQCKFPNCGRVYNEAYLLYDHEAQHYITFTCKSESCGKVFYSLSQLNLHHKEHMKLESFDGECSLVQSEMTPQASLDFQPTFNQDNLTPDYCFPKMSPNVQHSPNTTSNSTEEPNTSLSLISSLPHDQPPANDANVSQADEPVKSLNESDCKVSANQVAADLVTKFHLKPCFVKLQPIPIKDADPFFLNALDSSDAMMQSILQDKKLFCLTCKQHKLAPKVTEVEETMEIDTPTQQPLPQKEQENDELLTHICPFETCTRKYSTSKSLSRHVKNVHIEAFEEWKLSRKYKRIAETAARRSLEPKNPTIPTPKKRIKGSTSAMLQYKGVQATRNDVVLQTVSDPSGPVSEQSFNASFCPSFDSAQSEPPLPEAMSLQTQMVQSWNPSSFDGYNSAYSMHNQYSAMTMPPDGGLDQSYPLYMPQTDMMAERNMDYVPNVADDPNTGLTSVLNEASKYVSNSLRVLHALNSDQTCEVAQIPSNEDLGFVEIRPEQNSVVPSNVVEVQSASNNFSPYFPSYPAEMCPSSSQSIEKTEKTFPPNQDDEIFSSEAKIKTHFASPICKEEPQCFSVSNAPSVSLEGEQDDHPSPQEIAQMAAEDMSPGDKSVTSPGEINKAKKIKTSKRTKWPAILKDGKVICCRCYREFSSTKSLGGHLSKRSQCKPLDEVDLTADLPTSFLDFLNDPDILSIQTSPHASNMHGQTSQTFTQPHTDSNALNSDSFVDISSLNYSMQNGHMPEPSEQSFIEPPEQSADSSSIPFLNAITVDVPNRVETELNRNFEPTMPLEIPSDDGKILEIEKALQRLDLVDGLTQNVNKVEIPVMQKPTSDRDAACKMSNEPKTKGKINCSKNLLKPFKCNQLDCTYGAMTKEALFKHLNRVHELSEDKINELKENPCKLSPYNCHVCTKSFTRTTGLKIHYKNVHHFSKEEIAKLKIGKQCKRTVATDGATKCENNNLANSREAVLCSPDTVQIQSLSSPTLKTSFIIKIEPADLESTEEWCKQNPLPSKISSPADVSLERNSLGLLAVNNLKPPQVPCQIAENTTVQCSMIEEPQVLTTEHPLSPVHCDTVQASNIRVELSKEPLVEPKDKSKKIKSKDKVEPHKKDSKKPADRVDPDDAVDDLSQYRPYRCIHEGCVAAFSIQHNLMLHYKAMHHSELEEGTNAPTTVIPVEQVDGSTQVHEFRCQMKECSKVVSKVTSLLKHYLLLHRCTLEKASALLSGVEFGKFQCDQSKCPANFTCHLKYIEHIKNDHKAIRVSADGDFERVDLTFQCEYEGCDRVYTTKSNLLRHFMKKHQSDLETINQKPKNGARENMSGKPIGTKPNDGKENISSNKAKLKKKKQGGKVRDHWTSFGNPSLKSKEEAFATCSGKFPVEYPCMIKGCDSVANSERNITKHYTTHGLTERYAENRRSHFIFCKRNSRLRNKIKSPVTSEDLTADPSVTSEVVNAEPLEFTETAKDVFAGTSLDDECGHGNVTVVTKEDVVMATPNNTSDVSEDAGHVLPSAPADTSEVLMVSPETIKVPENVLSNTSDVPTDRFTETNTVRLQDQQPENTALPGTEEQNKNTLSMSLRRKRGRPRKLTQTLKMNPERKQSLRNCSVRRDNAPKVSGTKSNSAAHFDQAESGVAQKLFSPLGFEASVLKLFEDPTSRKTFQRKSPASKRAERLVKQPKHHRSPSSLYKNSVFKRLKRSKQVVHFRNPLRLKSVKNVKIVMDGRLSNGADLLLKQLQDMRPMVILKKWLCS